MDQHSTRQVQTVTIPRTRRKRKVAIYVLIILIVILMLAAVGVAGFVGWQLTHPVSKPLEATPASMQLVYEDVEFKSRGDQLLLRGWYMPAQGQSKDMTIVMAHGYRQNREQADIPALSIADLLVQSGYGVLMFDFRNSGESEGNVTSVGQYEKDDLLGAIDWVAQEHPGTIALLGFSMGATTSILAAAEAPEVVGLVADSPFSQLRTYLKDNLSVWSGLPEFPFTPLIMTIIPPLTGLNVDEVDALSAVERVYPRPILFIHGVEDSKIPYTESVKMSEKHPDVFELWAAPKGDHMKVYSQQTDEYTERILAFFERLAQEN